MTGPQLMELRERLLTTRAKLLDYVADKADADMVEPGWLNMIAGVQAALQAVDEAMEEGSRDGPG